MARQLMKQHGVGCLKRQIGHLELNFRVPELCSFQGKVHLRVWCGVVVVWCGVVC